MGVAPDIGDTPGSGRDGSAAAVAWRRRRRACVRAHVQYVRYLTRVMFERSLYLHLWLSRSLARSAFFTWRESFSALPP